ncbi:beta-mannosidase [Gracilibacillus kekensis]|uniref:Beta-mannosidase B n=1 Tax=Gracilibacillus kekensis TaxID=1027249 RepID=A0A1M7JZ17_9BACI|nr:glycoside hydrolase family 2 protein [Gracilibacillus kekensis]SHM58238.1 beta-mannosidase [Gracilibacillus kekensis]
MKQIKFNHDWYLRNNSEEEQYKVNLPASVIHTLLEEELIPDPFYRDNEDQALMLSANDYVFLKEFEMDGALLSHENIQLKFHGIDTIAKIEINDQTIGSTDNMHRIYEFDVKSILCEGTNKLKVTLYSPVDYVQEKNRENQLPGVHHAVEGFQHLRKSHSMFGWDWGPKIPDLGIWRDVELIAWNDNRIQDVYVSQKHSPKQRKVEVTISTELVTEDRFVDKTVILTSPCGKQVKKAFEQSETSLFIEEPQIWWPAGYGEQPLYQVEVLISKNNRLLDKVQKHIGLRTIEVRHEPDQWGKSFEFIVNGFPLFMKGANYIPEDNLLPRLSKERTKQVIEDSVAANFNMIRVWGGGHYPEDYFYDLCDKNGIIVWQDFMFACSVYPMTEAFHQNVEQEAIDQIKRIRHHASLGIWCGNNEVEEAMEYWGWPDRKDWRDNYITLFEKTLKDIVAEYDPQTFYWPSSPSSGGGFIDPKNPDVGDVHYWEVWHGQKPFTEYRKYHFRFCSEFGFQAFPGLQTVESFTILEDRNIFSRIMEKHQKNDDANGKILYYLSENFLYPKDFSTLLYTSQLLQAEAIKYGVEHWRRNLGRCMGSLYWQLNDCWPVASWSSVDYFGRWKALHYFAKKFYDPILLSIEEQMHEASIYVTNDHLNGITGRVEWKLRNNKSDILQKGTIDIEVEALTAKALTHLDLSDEINEVTRYETYLEATLYIDGSPYSQSMVLFSKPKHFKFLNPHMSIAVEEDDDHYMLNVKAHAFTKYVEIQSTVDLPLSDNYFDLSANETKQITVKKNKMPAAMTKQTIENSLETRSVYHISAD